MPLCHRLLLDCLGAAASEGADFLRSSGGNLLAATEDEDANVRWMGFLFGGGGLGGRGRRDVTVGGSDSIYIYSCFFNTESSSFTAYGSTTAVGCLTGIVCVYTYTKRYTQTLYGCVHVSSGTPIERGGAKAGCG